MSEMVERVALAIWRARESAFPLYVQRLEPDQIDKSSGAWVRVVAEACAAIDAMRDPTEPMLNAAEEAASWDNELDERKQAQVAWSAMIDAALR